MHGGGFGVEEEHDAAPPRPTRALHGGEVASQLQTARAQLRGRRLARLELDDVCSTP